MENKRVTLELPEGNFITTVSQFTNEDASSLKTIYESWRTLCGTWNVNTKLYIFFKESN